MNSPRVTDTDRQRGWAELEIELTDGACECVRVHALDQADLILLAALSPVAALSEGLALTLRADAAFVARITPKFQVAIMAMQSLLIFGDVEGRAGVAVATAATIKLRRAGEWPVSTEAMRDCIAECAASLEPFKAALQGLMQSSKIRPITPI